MFFSIYLLAQSDSVEVALQIRGRLPGLLGYVVAACLGAATLCTYWWFIGKVVRKTETPKPNLEHVVEEHDTKLGMTTKADLVRPKKKSLDMKAGATVYRPPKPTASASQIPFQNVDVEQMLKENRLWMGWTLHNRAGEWSVYSITNTDLLDDVTKQALQMADATIPTDLLSRVNALWVELSKRLPKPRPIENAYGPIEGQTFVEHLSRQTRSPNTLHWNYEVLRNGSGVAVKDPKAADITISELSPAAMQTVQDLDTMTQKIVNRRYIEAVVKVSK